MAIVNISDELYEEVQALLKEQLSALSADALVEAAVIQYLADELNQAIPLEPQELSELLLTIEEDEADEAAGIGYTLEEAQQRAKERLETNYQVGKASA